jgi:hypothetical protein
MAFATRIDASTHARTTDRTNERIDTLDPNDLASLERIALMPKDEAREHVSEIAQLLMRVANSQIAVMNVLKQIGEPSGVKVEKQ